MLERLTLDNEKPVKREGEGTGRAVQREDPTVPVELVTVRTVDQVLLHGALVQPQGANGALLGVHGAWGNFYGTPVAQLLVDAPARGLAALSMNARGHDLGSLGDGERCIGLMRDRFTDATFDLEAAVSVLRERGLDRIVVVAHSYGASSVAYWQSAGATQVAGLVFLSPAPMLQTTAHWFVDGSPEHHLARAAAAVAAGHPERLIVLAETAPVPMVAEAATVLDIWGPDTLADATRYMPALTIPVLVVVGRREPDVYRRRAEHVAELSPYSELLVRDDDHYYQRDRPAMAAAVLDWQERHHLLEAAK